MRVTYPINSKKISSPLFRQDPRLDKGQAFVELALVLPVFILLLVGVVQAGYLAYASIEAASAARAGVAYAAQSRITASDTSNITLAATQDAPNISGMTVTTALACYCDNGTTTTKFSSCAGTVANTVTCPSPSHIIESVQVNTQASVSTVFHLAGIGNPFTVQGQAIMGVEQ